MATEGPSARPSDTAISEQVTAWPKPRHRARAKSSEVGELCGRNGGSCHLDVQDSKQASKQAGKQAGRQAGGLCPWLKEANPCSRLQQPTRVYSVSEKANDNKLGQLELTSPPDHSQPNSTRRSAIMDMEGASTAPLAALVVAKVNTTTGTTGHALSRRTSNDTLRTDETHGAGQWEWMDITEVCKSRTRHAGLPDRCNPPPGG